MTAAKSQAFKESDRVQQVKLSGTLAVFMEAERLRSEGVDVVDLGAGEPDFPTPRNIKRAAQQAIDENFTRYTAVGGIHDLKVAIVDLMQNEFKAEYDACDIVVTVGGKQAIFNAMAALLNPGDEVLIPTPHWVTFPEIATLFQAVPVFVETASSDFVLTPEAVAERITERTRLLILNSPNNPTGRVIPPAQFQKIVELAAEHDICVISDECYLQFVYPPARPFTAGQLPTDLRSRVMVCGSFSKTYAMTGWRIGFGAGDRHWIKAMLKVQSHSTSNASSVSQKAAQEAAEGPRDSVRFMLGEYKRRRDWLIPALDQIEGIRCGVPEGAFYAFPDIRGLLGGRVKTSSELATFLLDRARVVVTSGSAFGAEGYLRISYAAALDEIKRGVERIAGAAAELAKG